VTRWGRRPRATTFPNWSPNCASATTASAASKPTWPRRAARPSPWVSWPCGRR